MAGSSFTAVAVLAPLVATTALDRPQERRHEPRVAPRLIDDLGPDHLPKGIRLTTLLNLEDQGWPMISKVMIDDPPGPVAFSD